MMRCLLAVSVLFGIAHAEGIGLYAPSAPFAGPVERLDYVTGLAATLGGGLVGHVYARASDFAAAVKRGEISYAVVDAAYLAAQGSPYPVLATARRGGQTEAPWEVVSALPVTSLSGLRGLGLAVPAIGARDEAFLTQVLLEGELPRDFFGRVSFAPDARSALAAVERGRADCAVVPSGLPRAPGVHRVATLRAVSWPVLVALPGAEHPDAVAGAAARAHGTVLEGFVAGGEGAMRALAGRFTHEERRAPLVSPPLRLAGAALVGGRTYTIRRVPVTDYLLVPDSGTNHR